LDLQELVVQMLFLEELVVVALAQLVWELAQQLVQQV
jgi:hypothetical protein